MKNLRDLYFLLDLYSGLSHRSKLDRKSTREFLKDTRYTASPISKYSEQEFIRYTYYKDNYDVVSLNALHSFCHPKPIGRERGVRTCRFCKKSRPETSFKKTAHVTPCFTGNKIGSLSRSVTVVIMFFQNTKVILVVLQTLNAR